MATRGGKRSNSGRAKLVDPVQLMFCDPPTREQKRCQWIITAVRKVEADIQFEWGRHYALKTMVSETLKMRKLAERDGREARNARFQKFAGAFREADERREGEEARPVRANDTLSEIQELRTLQSDVRGLKEGERRSAKARRKIDRASWHFHDWKSDPDPKRHDPKLHSESPKLARICDIPPMPPIWRGKVYAEVAASALKENGWRITRRQIKRCLAAWAAFEKQISG